MTIIYKEYTKNLIEENIIVYNICQKVIDIGAIYEYNSNSYNATRCPFCTGFEYHDRGSMDTIKHDNDCAWLLAKDLSTGLL